MILVTGGAGVMGSRLVRRLAELGHSVRALVLPGDPLVSRLFSADGRCPCEVCEGDITEAAGLAGAMRGVETVFHLAAVIVSRDPARFTKINVEGTRNVVRAAATAGVKHLVYVSSASVTYRNPTDYSRSKAAAEEIVRGEKSFEHTVVRPTLVYDRTGGQEMEMLARYVRLLPVVPFIGSGKALKRPVYAGDIIDGLAVLPGNAKAYGKVYNFSGGEAVSMMELARLLARQVGPPSGLRRVIVPVPEFVWRAGLGVLGFLVRSPAFARQIIAGFTEDADLDPGPAMRDLGYDPLPASVGIPRYFHVRRTT